VAVCRRPDHAPWWPPPSPHVLRCRETQSLAAAVAWLMWGGGRSEAKFRAHGMPEVICEARHATFGPLTQVTLPTPPQVYACGIGCCAGSAAAYPAALRVDTPVSPPACRRSSGGRVSPDERPPAWSLLRPSVRPVLPCQSWRCARCRCAHLAFPTPLLVSARGRRPPRAAAA
jgi:hypothetical protein